MVFLASLIGCFFTKSFQNVIWNHPLEASATIQLDDAQYDFDTPYFNSTVRFRKSIHVLFFGGGGGQGLYFLLISDHFVVAHFTSTYIYCKCLTFSPFPRHTAAV